MTITLPRLRFLAPLFAASVFCASALGGYFSSGSAGVLTACFLLFLLTAAVRPTRREWGVGAIPAALFAFFRTVGYSYDTTDSSDLLLKNAQTMLRGAAAMAALFAAALCAVVLLFRLLDALRAHTQSGAPATQKEKRRLFWLCAGLIFAGSIPYLLLYAPGLNIYDTHDQILQFFGFPSYIGDGSALSDHHPVFLTLIYGGFMKLGLLLGDANIGQLLYSLLSMAALAACWAYALVTLREAGLARGAVIGLALFVALYPVLALYAFNMCKDVSVEPFVLLYGTMMFRLYASHGRVAQSGRFCAGLFAVALMMMLTRKPAMYALCFAALFLLLGYPGVRARLAGALLGAAAVFAVLYNGLLLPALGVIPGETREMLSVPFQQTARFVSEYASEVTDEERAAIDGVLVYDELAKRYQPELSDPVKATYRKTATPRDWLAYGQAWASQMIRHPGCYLSATIIQNALLFDVSTYNLAIFTGTGLSAQEEEALDIHRSGTLTRLEKMESSLRQVALALPFVLQFNTLGFYCAVLLGACAIACSRKARGMLTILLPQMLTMAVILCGPCIEHQDRYGFPVIYLMPLALAALSCALRRTQRD